MAEGNLTVTNLQISSINVRFMLTRFMCLQCFSMLFLPHGIFLMWGIDMIEMIEPKVSNVHCFILVVIDYFTKWVEVTSYANVTKQVVAHIIKNNIIFQYSVPSRIITDNGSNLNNKMMTKLYEEFKIF